MEVHIMREIYAKNVPTIGLGRQGENLVTQVIYDLSDWIAAYGDGTAELIHKRIGDSQPYPVAAVREAFGEFDEQGNPVYYPKTQGTATSTSFCVITIDRKNRKVHATAYGAGIDREISY